MTSQEILPTKKLNDSAFIRWGVLLLISTVMFASYFFYDVFSAIKSTLQSELGFSNSDYGQMVGFYAFANSFLLMTIFGGVILDKWGIRKTGLLFISIMTLGTVTTAYGASDLFKEGAFGYGFMSSFLKGYSPELKMMILGRILFGLGAETIYVVINKIMVKWFKGKELALAFGVNLAIARFGTAAALMFSPVLITFKTGWSTAGWFGSMLVIISLVTFVLYALFDVKFDKYEKQAESDDPSEEFHFSDIIKLVTNPSFLFITMLCVTFYSAVFPFLSYAPDFLHNKFGFSLKLSGDISTILPYGTIIFTPLFGWYTDKKGKSASVMILGSLLLIVVHFTLALTGLSPYIPIFVLGIAFSLVPAAMWPSVAKIVDEKSLGTAYGFMFFIQNFGLFAFPWLVGKVLDVTNPGNPKVLDYTYAILMLGILGILGIIFAFLLKRSDKKAGYGLDLPNQAA